MAKHYGPPKEQKTRRRNHPGHYQCKAMLYTSVEEFISYYKIKSDHHAAEILEVGDGFIVVILHYIACGAWYNDVHTIVDKFNGEVLMNNRRKGARKNLCEHAKTTTTDAKACYSDEQRDQIVTKALAALHQDLTAKYDEREPND